MSSIRSLVFAQLSHFFIMLAIFTIVIIRPVHAASWQTFIGDKAFQEGYFQVVGLSGGGQSKFEALRSAKVIAQRDLLEAIQKMPVQWKVTLKDGMQKDNRIQKHVEGFLEGAHQCGQRYNLKDRSGAVCLRLYINGRQGIYRLLFPMLMKAQVLSVTPTKQNLRP